MRQQLSGTQGRPPRRGEAEASLEPREARGHGCVGPARVARRRRAPSGPGCPAAGAASLVAWCTVRAEQRHASGRGRPPLSCASAARSPAPQSSPCCSLPCRSPAPAGMRAGTGHPVPLFDSAARMLASSREVGSDAGGGGRLPCTLWRACRGPAGRAGPGRGAAGWLQGPAAVAACRLCPSCAPAVPQWCHSTVRSSRARTWASLCARRSSTAASRSTRWR